jgi:hypothetical protein
MDFFRTALIPLTRMMFVFEMFSLLLLDTMFEVVTLRLMIIAMIL